MSPEEEILEYVQLRKSYHERVRTTAPKQDKPFIDAILRELIFLERFTKAVVNRDDAVAASMRRNMINFNDTLKL